METVFAKPTKQFFVSMLTRDIDLKDAILDLLDNCIDGILRLQQNTHVESEMPYDGYWAKISATSEGFSIHDNCGGISRDIAINSAFRLGRADPERDRDLPTVGMYGIGMKRAMFKMGIHSRITSKHNGEAYQVEILPEWLTDDSNWELSLNDIEVPEGAPGTQIEVLILHPTIAEQFDPSASVFLQNLEKEIASLFALIILKGFKVFVNQQEVEPVKLDILSSSDFDPEEIQPYMYQATHEQVQVQLVVGFYRPPASVDEIEAEQEIPRSKDNAGWTVICNDRVVLHTDKSALTGWGDDGVPKFHNQFIAIAGIAIFSSTSPINLPLNTTKRGLDTMSGVYRSTLPFMRDGLKKFIDFTNKWKGREVESAPYFRRATSQAPTRIVATIPVEKWQSIRGAEPDARRYSPQLPMPSGRERNRRISFYRLQEEIAFLGNYFFDSPGAAPSEIGNRCFQEVYDRAKEEQ